MKYYRRVAMLTLRDSTGRLLLQHRTKNSPVLPDHWSFFGGGIEDGETPKQSLKREIKEELGIDLKKPRFFKRYEQKEEKGLYEKFLFTGNLDWPLKVLKKQQTEGDDAQVFSEEEIKAIKLSDNDRTILKEVFEKC